MREGAKKKRATHPIGVGGGAAEDDALAALHPTNRQRGRGEDGGRKKRKRDR
jgi:hypothetical protein